MKARKQLHQSEIKDFLKCGILYDFKHVQRIKTPPAAVATLGNSFDAGVTRNLIRKIESGKDLLLNEVLDAYSTDWDIRAPETDFDGEDPGTLKDTGIKMLKLHHENIAPTLDPATVQESFKIETDAGFDIGGTLDITTKDDVIIDNKTCSRARASDYTNEKVNHAFQPVMYDFAFEALRGRKAKGFRFDMVLRPSKTLPPEIRQGFAPITDEARNQVFNSIVNVSKAIDAGIALPAAEGSWWCSKDWCGYWNRCKGKRNPS